MLRASHWATGMVCVLALVVPVGSAQSTPSSPAAQSAQSAGTARQVQAIEQQFRRGEPTQALQKLDVALAGDPDDAALRFLKAVILSETGRSADAALLLEGLTQTYPELPEPYNNLAVLKAGAGQLNAAQALLETALRLDPSYRTAHENLGDVYVRLAQRAYQAALGGRPDAGLLGKLKLAAELSQVPGAGPGPRASLPGTPR